MQFQIVPKYDIAQCNLDRGSFNKLLYETLCTDTTSIDLLNIEYDDTVDTFTFRSVSLTNLYEVDFENIDAFTEEILAAVHTLKECIEVFSFSYFFRGLLRGYKIPPPLCHSNEFQHFSPSSSRFFTEKISQDEELDNTFEL